MKVECPICGVMGHLQVRGQSARVGHFQGYEGNTRIVEWHKVDASNLDSVINGNHSNQSLVINKLKMGISNLNNQGPVVQYGKTSPSRGEDRRFKSGPAHFLASFCCTFAQKSLLNITI